MPWSPSSVQDWLTCPRLWWCKRQGVTGRERDTQALDMGTQFHAHMANYWNDSARLTIALTPAPGDLVARAVWRTINQEGEALREQGVVGVEVNLDGDDAEAARHGRYPGTCDLITDNGAGLTVTDYKTKLNMEAKYADRELRQTQRSWQLLQYAWFVQVKYGRPVTHIRKLLVAFGPALKVWLVAYPVTQQALSAWHKQACQVWQRMDEMDEVTPFGLQYVELAWQNAESCERFGWEHRCEMYHKCWEGA